MTIVCAVRWHGVTYLGSDGRLTSGDRIMSGDARKWIIGHNGYAIGWAGTVVVLGLLRRHASEILDMQPTCDVIIDRIRRVFEQWKFKEDPTFQLLVVTPEGIHDVGREWDECGIADGQLAAIGSGAPYALGAYHGLTTAMFTQMPPVIIRASEKLNMAVMAAICYDIGCGGDIFQTEIRSMPETAATGGAHDVRSPVSVTYPCSEEGLGPLRHSHLNGGFAEAGEEDMVGQSKVGAGPAGDEVSVPADCE